jgi:hypothetical protein
MSTLEIIHLRLAGKPPENLCEQLKESIVAGGGLAENVMLFRRDGLETDLAVHIHHVDTQNSEPGKLGLRIASALKAHGLVEHQVWKQLK